MPDLILIDGKNWCFRAHHTHANLSSNGRPTSVIYGGINMLLTLAKHFPDTPITFAWDGGGQTWRHKTSKGTYKANRVPSPDAANVLQQIPIFKQFLEQAGIRSYEVAGLEGDDLIGILGTIGIQACSGGKVIICSTDRDYYQLLSKNCVLCKGRFDGEEDGCYTEKDFVSEYGIVPQRWIKFRALTGDSGDNIIKAKRGIGPKTALAMLDMGIDPALEHWTKQHHNVKWQLGYMMGVWPQVYLNYKLSRIITDPADPTLSEEVTGELARLLPVRSPGLGSFSRVGKPETAYHKALQFFSEYECEELIGRRHELLKIP